MPGVTNRRRRTCVFGNRWRIVTADDQDRQSTSRTIIEIATVAKTTDDRRDDPVLARRVSETEFKPGAGSVADVLTATTSQFIQQGVRLSPVQPIADVI